MLELNLVYENHSDIKYKISKFPDGQQDITISKLGVITPVKVIDEVVIKSRFNSFKDLELIICATKALRNLRVNKIHLFIPYILGARSDRQFSDSGTSYLRDVVAPILNAQNYETVTCVDAHSDVASACINNLIDLKNVNIFKSLLKIDTVTKDYDFILVSPDAGAMKKVYNLVEKIEYKKEIVIASKHRDITTGKIVSTNVPITEDGESTDHYVIVDDICDGGRTFIEIAKVIKEKRPNAKVSLVVTHGIFSGGYYELSKHIDHLYCTNSVKDTEVGQDSDYTVDNNYVTQINLF